MAYYSKDSQGNPRKGRNLDELLDKIQSSKIENGTISIGGNSITPITEQEADAKYPTKQDVSDKVDRSELSEVAISGDYNDLENKPTLPSTFVTSVNNQTGAVTIDEDDMNLSPHRPHLQTSLLIRNLSIQV